MIHRGVEHYERKEQKEQRKALAKINQGDLKDAQKHQMKAHKAADKANSLRPPTPPLVMAPTSPPMSAPAVPVAHRPVPQQQNLKGYNFGGLGGGFGPSSVQSQTPAFTQPMKPKKMPPQPINFNQPQTQPQQIQHSTPGHVMSPVGPAHPVPVMQHQHVQQPHHPHGHPGVHKFKGGVAAGGMGGVSNVSGMSGGMGGIGSPVMSSPQMPIVSHPQMVLSPQHANHVPAAVHAPQNRFSSQPQFDNHVGVQPGGMHGVGMGGISNHSSGAAGGLNMPQMPMAEHHKVRPQKPNKVASGKPQPPPPAPSTVSSLPSPTEIAPTTTTLQFTDQNKKLVPHAPVSGDHVQMVKKW